MTCLLYWVTGFRGENFKTFFPIGSYVKTMSADGDHFEPRSVSLNTNLEVDHLRTIDDMFAILVYWFQRDPMGNMFLKSSPLKPVSQFKANMA
jgi:hypothetical protein